MRRWHSTLARFSAAAMLASLLALVGNNSANADEVLQWPSASLSDISNPQALISDAQGGVTVGCSNLGSTAFKRFNSSGVSAGVGNSAQPTPDACANQSAIGADGTLYTVAYTSSATVLAAYAGTTLKWTYHPPCGGAVRSLVVGANGNIYMVLANGSGCSYPKLVGIEPVVQSGQTEPQVVADTYIYGSVVMGGSLAAYNNGLVVRMTSGIAYFNHAGVESSNEPGTLILAPHYGREFNATTAGRVFVPTKASSSTISSCGNDQSVVGSIDAYDAGETTATWSYALSGCTWVYQLSSAPTGGVVAHVATQSGQSVEEKLVGLSHVDGHLLWQHPLSSIDQNGNTLNGVAYAVDLKGEIVIEREVRIDQDSLVLPAVWVTVLNPNGTIRSSFTLTGNRSAGYGYRSTTLAVSSLSIGRDTVFVSVRECTSVTNCNGSNAKLFAVKVSGLEADYPRGLTLGQTPRSPVAESDYVALGDSFSSAEGVPPFDSASTSNGCHRSTRAYSHLLDASPSQNLVLQAFVACSGATTGNVLNGQNGENPQVNSLGTSTDIVTITIGGNDIGFVDFLIACVNPLTNCNTSSAAYANAMDKITNDLPDSLDGLYIGQDGIQDRVGTNTRVLVVGYPRVVPYDDSLLTCGILSSDERTAARQAITGLNNAIQDAVTRAGSQFEFVDADAVINGVRVSPFATHEYCSDDSYFNGIGTAVADPSYAMHPNVAGQAAYAHLVNDYLVTHP